MPNEGLARAIEFSEQHGPEVYNPHLEQAAQAITDYNARQASRPEPPPDYPARYNSAQVDSLQPFAYNSWEAMTNVEKFDELRNELMRLTELVEATANTYGRDLRKMLETFEQHAHAQDGSVMVKYSRSTL